MGTGRGAQGGGRQGLVVQPSRRCLPPPYTTPTTRGLWGFTRRAPLPCTPTALYSHACDHMVQNIAHGACGVGAGSASELPPGKQRARRGGVVTTNSQTAGPQKGDKCVHHGPQHCHQKASTQKRVHGYIGCVTTGSSRAGQPLNRLPTRREQVTGGSPCVRWRVG